MAYPQFHPFSLGNVLTQGENILNARAQRDPNSLQNQLLAAKLKQAQALGGGLRVAPLSTKEHTVDSIAEAMQTGDISALERYNRPDKPYKVDTGTHTEFWGIDRATRSPVLIKKIPNNVEEAARLGATGRTEAQLEAEMGEGGSPSKADVARSVETAKTDVGRAKEYISEGLAAADSMSTIRRGISLLESGVKTGGWDNLKLWATDTLGITGADEGELSANLGKAVLSQLRATFGAQFTEREGARLERIEAGFGKSPAVNLRLLQNILKTVERSARRGMSAAKSAGDDFTYNEIKAAMEAVLEDSPEAEAPEPEMDFSNMTDEQLQEIINQ